jgi:transcriptional regulator with XRE-family HTH domain
MREIMIHNKAFVEAVEREQKKQGVTQAEFAQYLGVSQGALSKFYSRGIRDGVVIKVLAKFPYLAHFFASVDSNRN